MFRLNCFTPCIKYKNPKIYKSILKIKKLPKNKKDKKKHCFTVMIKKKLFQNLLCKKYFYQIKKNIGMFCKIQLQLQLIFKCKYYLNITFIFV